MLAVHVSRQARELFNARALQGTPAVPQTRRGCGGQPCAWPSLPTPDRPGDLVIGKVMAQVSGLRGEPR